MKSSPSPSFQSALDGNSSSVRDLSFQDFSSAASAFVERLLQEAHKSGAPEIQSPEIDHLCFRVSSLNEYEAWKAKLRSWGTQISEAFVNGRPIACFELREAVITASGQPTRLVELPAPKPEKPYTSGFEHIEIVTTTPLEKLVEGAPLLNFSTPIAADDPNATVSLRLKQGVIKYHNQSLASVIQAEKQRLQQSGRKPLAIFDFDDTICDTTPFFLRAVRKVIENKLGHTLSDDELRKKARPTFPEFFAGFGWNDPDEFLLLLKEFQNAWEPLAAEIQPHTGVSTLLSCLQDTGHSIVVWTARDLGTTKSSLQTMGLDHHVEDIFACEAIDASKPKPPQGLVDLVQASEVSWLCGDSASDAAGARQLGVPFFKANWIRNVPIEGAADACFSEPLELLLEAMAKPAA